MQRRRRKRKIRQLYINTIIFIIIAFISINLINGVIAKYRSSATSSANVDLAYYIFKEESISQELKLQSILPRENPYIYTFLVANYKEEERTQTALEYTIKIKTTTNLPLQYKVHKENEDTDLVTEVKTEQDIDGTYFKYINVQGDEFGFRQNEENIYKLEIKFPPEYNLAEYEGIIEYIELTIDSKQKIN